MTLKLLPTVPSENLAVVKNDERSVFGCSGQEAHLSIHLMKNQGHAKYSVFSPTSHRHLYIPTTPPAQPRGGAGGALLPVTVGPGS